MTGSSSRSRIRIWSPLSLFSEPIEDCLVILLFGLSQWTQSLPFYGLHLYLNLGPDGAQLLEVADDHHTVRGAPVAITYSRTVANNIAPNPHSNASGRQSSIWMRQNTPAYVRALVLMTRVLFPQEWFELFLRADDGICTVSSSRSPLSLFLRSLYCTVFLILCCLYG